jgi:hypothetical protein
MLHYEPKDGSKMRRIMGSAYLQEALGCCQQLCPTEIQNIYSISDELDTIFVFRENIRDVHSLPIQHTHDGGSNLYYGRTRSTSVPSNKRKFEEIPQETQHLRINLCISKDIPEGIVVADAQEDTVDMDMQEDTVDTDMQEDTVDTDIPEYTTVANVQEDMVDTDIQGGHMDTDIPEYTTVANVQEDHTATDVQEDHTATDVQEDHTATDVQEDSAGINELGNITYTGEYIVNDLPEWRTDNIKKNKPSTTAFGTKYQTGKKNDSLADVYTGVYKYFEGIRKGARGVHKSIKSHAHRASLVPSAKTLHTFSKTKADPENIQQLKDELMEKYYAVIILFYICLMV